MRLQLSDALAFEFCSLFDYESSWIGTILLVLHYASKNIVSCIVKSMLYTEEQDFDLKCNQEPVKGFLTRTVLNELNILVVI